MPHNYRPSLADISIARLIASSTNEMLPPIALPSVGSLLGILESPYSSISVPLYLYLGGSLLQKYFWNIQKFRQGQGSCLFVG